MKKLIFYILLMMLVGCETPMPANQTWLTFNSSPPGARISSEGIDFGLAPATLAWVPNKANPISSPVTATWISGATASIKANLIVGRQASYMISRPAELAGLDADVQWAISAQQKAVAAEQVRQQNLANVLQSYNTGRAAANTQNIFPQTLDCTSTKNGNTIRTSCY